MSRKIAAKKKSAIIDGSHIAERRLLGVSGELGLRVTRLNARQH